MNHIIFFVHLNFNFTKVFFCKIENYFIRAGNIFTKSLKELLTPPTSLGTVSIKTGTRLTMSTLIIHTVRIIGITPVLPKRVVCTYSMSFFLFSSSIVNLAIIAVIAHKITTIMNIFFILRKNERLSTDPLTLAGLLSSFILSATGSGIIGTRVVADPAAWF